MLREYIFTLVNNLTRGRKTAVWEQSIEEAKVRIGL